MDASSGGNGAEKGEPRVPVIVPRHLHHLPSEPGNQNQQSLSTSVGGLFYLDLVIRERCTPMCSVVSDSPNSNYIVPVVTPHSIIDRPSTPAPAHWRTFSSNLQRRFPACSETGAPCITSGRTRSPCPRPRRNPRTGIARLRSGCDGCDSKTIQNRFRQGPLEDTLSIS